MSTMSYIHSNELITLKQQLNTLFIYPYLHKFHSTNVNFIIEELALVNKWALVNKKATPKDRLLLSLVLMTYFHKSASRYFKSLLRCLIRQFDPYYEAIIVFKVTNHLLGRYLTLSIAEP